MFTSPAKNDSKNQSTSSFARQGSSRKVIPPPEVDRENLFGRQNEDLNDIFKTYRQEYVILAEYKLIENEYIPGIYVIPSRENTLVWFGVIFARNGPYKDGIFRFSILLDEKFPDCGHPKVVFESKIVHPVIDAQTNELNLHGAFPNWHKTEQHLWQVLKYIQWIFANFQGSLKHAVNKEACELFNNNRQAFETKAQEIVELSRKNLYEAPPTEDKHYIVFEKFNPEIHSKEKMFAFLKEKSQTGGKSGYSWVLPGSLKPLERPPTPPSDDEVKEYT